MSEDIGRTLMVTIEPHLLDDLDALAKELAGYLIGMRDAFDAAGRPVGYSLTAALTARVDTTHVIKGKVE